MDIFRLAMEKCRRVKSPFIVQAAVAESRQSLSSHVALTTSKIWCG